MPRNPASGRRPNVKGSRPRRPDVGLVEVKRGEGSLNALTIIGGRRFSLFRTIGGRERFIGNVVITRAFLKTAAPKNLKAFYVSPDPTAARTELQIPKGLKTANMFQEAALRKGKTIALKRGFTLRQLDRFAQMREIRKATVK